MSSPSSPPTSSEGFEGVSPPSAARHEGPSVGAPSDGGSRPTWCRPLDALIERAIVQLSVIASCTPRNLALELAALENDFEAGRARRPRFHHEPRANDAWIEGLGRARDEVRALGPWGELYEARLRELWLEAHIGRTAGTDELGTWAAKRYAARDDFHAAADELCARWLAEPAPTPAPRSRRSDDEADRGSLVSRLRAEVGRRRLPFRVEVARGLSALAATGPKSIFVAPGRAMSDDAVARTVMHEVEGHALPRARAQSLGGLFVRGTAFGSDDQEGRAIHLEAQYGHLGPERRRELALRHHACALTREGIDFVTVARTLWNITGRWRDALRITARAQRGGGETGGLTRESVYLPAYLRVTACIETDPTADRWLGAGQVATCALPALRQLCPEPDEIETKP